jgi:hypothetical protein
MAVISGELGSTGEPAVPIIPFTVQLTPPTLGVEFPAVLIFGEAAVPQLEGVELVDLETRMLQEQELKRMQAATKSDDAEIPIHLWDCRILPHLLQSQRGPILKPIRSFVLRCWRKRTMKDFLQWFRLKYPLCYSPSGFNVKRIWKGMESQQDWVAGRDCIARCADSSWWEWDSGFHPLHWRWSPEYRSSMEWCTVVVS